MAIARGTLICSRCLKEFDITGTTEMEIDPDGYLITMLVPDVASTAILSAHMCELQP
jgi:hypothetical protein